MRATVLRVGLAVVVVLTLLPALASAQSGIAGVVKDATGAVLPGVTVEAASPALIEKVRTAVTDSQGRYNVVDLRPGIYIVTFTLTGFSALRREGIELTTNFTANVNAELRVGAIEESVTVSGASPVVDVQNIVQQRVVNIEVIEEIPTGRTEQTLAALVPGMIVRPVSNPVVQDVGGSSGDMRQTLTIHGSRVTDFNEMIEGIPMNAMTNINTGGINMDTGAVQEFSYEVGGNSAERGIGGVAVNIIPKEGGNRFIGTAFFNYGSQKLQSDNLDDDLIRRGFTVANKLDKNWDVNPSLGGPILRDKLWFYFSTRYWGYDNLVSQYYNKTQGTFPPVFTRDLSRQAVDDSWLGSATVRLTYQVSSNNRIGVFLLDQGRCLCHQNVGANTAPEASRRARSREDYLLQGSWTAPLKSGWLLEAAAQHYRFYQQYDPQDGVDRSTLSVVEQTTGLNYNAPLQGWFAHPSWIHNARASAAHVTGSHSFKTGFTLQWGKRHYLGDTFGDLNLTVRNGAPIQVTMNATPFDYWMHLNDSTGVYAQDQWTIKRVTLNLGIRYEHLRSSVPEQHIPAVRFVGPRDYAAIDNVPNWSDINPRLGLNINVFGNGKTAIKAAIGRYVEGHTIGFAQNVNPVNTSTRTANRSWTDTNSNFYPDCDFVNAATNGECGPTNLSNFGKPIVTTTYDDDIREGWGKRPYSWEANAGVQHELAAGVGLSVQYFRRWYGNFYATDNQLVSPADYSPFNFPAPADPRLPSGGQVLTGFYDISQNKFGQSQNLVTFADRFGKQIEHYNGVDVNIDARLPARIRVGGGFNIGRTETNNCFVVDSPQQAFWDVSAPASAKSCANKTPFQPQVKVNATYPLAWYDIQLSGTFQSVTGPEILAPYSATNAEVAPLLGRNLASGPNGTVVLPLVNAGTLFGDRVYQVDFRLMKAFKVGRRVRVRGSADFYNALNTNAVLLYNNTYGPAWQRPNAVMPGRLFKFGAQLDF